MIDQKALNDQHARWPMPGDYWHEMFAPVCVVCDANDVAVTVCRKVVDIDPDHWTWDLSRKQTMTRVEFVEFLSYGSGVPDYWADVIPEHMPWAVAEGCMRLTQHFHLEEFEVSEVARRRGIDNRVPEALLPNLSRLAGLLEQVRLVLGGRPITITSGYRAPLVNEIVGGAPKSAHMDARAADFICPSFGSVQAICDEIRRSAIEYDQLKDEYNGWVHISVPRAGVSARRQFLRAR